MKYLLLGHGVANNGAKRLLDKLGRNYDYLEIDEVKDKYDIIVKSPGISLINPFFEGRKEEIISDIELGYRLVKPFIICVTGSNGKTTVSSMIAYALKKRCKAILCGNIGYSFCDALVDNPCADIFVVEASSFQLEAVSTFDPNIAVLLNVSPCHLDHHKDYRSYIDAKLNITNFQSLNHHFVYLADTPFLKKINKNKICKCISFSLTNINSDYIYYDDYIYCNSTKLMKIKKEIKQFPHKIYNYMAVCAVLKILGFNGNKINKALRGFKEVRYRLERIAANIINDAKSTNCSSTQAALLGFDNVLLICGGYDRGIDITLSKNALDKIISVYAYGASRDKIKAFMDMHNIECHTYERLKQAFDDAYNNLSTERVLLYSPMFASFDQYEGYTQRAEEFERLIKSVGNHL